MLADDCLALWRAAKTQRLPSRQSRAHRLLPQPRRVRTARPESRRGRAASTAGPTQHGSMRATTLRGVAARLAAAAALVALCALQSSRAKQPPTAGQLAAWRDDLKFSIEYLSDLPAELQVTSAPAGSIEAPGKFPSVCTCRPPLLGSLTSCGPSHLTVVVSDPGGLGESPGALTQLTQRVRWHLGPAWNYRAANFSRHYMSSVDHRSPDEVIGTWGGDFGELVLALAVAEERLGRDMRDLDVNRFVVAFVRQSPAEHFFFGTDAEALAFVAAACGREELDPTAVPGPLQERALDAMLHQSGAGMGDSHLRWLVSAPDDYGLRRGLLEAAVRSFHQLLWRPPFPWWRSRIRYFVHHRRQRALPPFAVLEVMASPDCTRERRTLPVPQLAGNPAGAVLVFHPQAIEAKRRAAAGMVRQLDQGPFDAAAKAVLSKGADWDDASRSKLAAMFPGLPLVQVVTY